MAMGLVNGEGFAVDASVMEAFFERTDFLKTAIRWMRSCETTEASKCYIDALQHDKDDIPSLVAVYTKISRMRVLSSPRVIDCAETGA